MGEFILFLLIFVGIMVISALIFGGWFIVMIVRGIASFFGLRHDVPPIETRRASGAVRIGPVLHGQGHGRTGQCGNPLCRAPNAATARFCRRCGQRMAQSQPVTVRRAAVW
jgi:hypothetical protein